MSHRDDDNISNADVLKILSGYGKKKPEQSKGTKKSKRKEYIRPNKTFTDTLSDKDVRGMLEDYVKIEPEDYEDKLTMNSDIRYFTFKDGERTFRMGGIVASIKGLPVYLVLKNKKTNSTWSIQLKDCIIYKRMNVEEIKEEYEEEMDSLEQENDKLRRENAKLIKHIQYLESKLRNTTNNRQYGNYGYGHR
jgi:FtsZ-binding cell division protein ZapB